MASDMSELADIEQKVDELKHDIESLKAQVTKLNDTMNKYKGFAGGVMFVITAVWAFLQLVWTQVVDGKTGH
jgi:wobble nucleotide-excising tRNase